MTQRGKAQKPVDAPDISINITDAGAEVFTYLDTDPERVGEGLRWLLELGYTEMSDQSFDPDTGVEKMFFTRPAATT